ncbi:decarboxylating NADP(+)-dependent phosphogluconate dehydrogenase, partial [Parabacteroides sp. OttesenSCG-928-N08]|nr:decarboxylating NADP(+)-dependent phosphogluconate dehydrogenase [Parabacteroides sp. OttesenSCG-928-N08]
DGGNSDYRDTTRRVKALEAKGIYFVGAGVSGGETGALLGPAIMPGGSAPAWQSVKEILQAIAAKTAEGLPCCEWIGAEGSGHFVKMVHNGIEYGDMQLIAESYALLRGRLGLDNEAMADLFDAWNGGDLESYLVEITADILRYPAEEGGYLLDRILDVAGQKGTGKWSVESALDNHDPLTLITEAVYARMLSGRLEQRHTAARLYPHQPTDRQPAITAEDIRQSLYASKLVSYAQGFSLLRKAATEKQWHLDYGTIARIWRQGCIIRSAFLTDITAAYSANGELENLLFDHFFLSKIEEALPAWRRVVAEGALHGIALPAMSAALNYFDGLRTAHSPANLIQAQRDYFGAHTYERSDRPRGQFFHTNWSGEGGETVSTPYTV